MLQVICTLGFTTDTWSVPQVAHKSPVGLKSLNRTIISLTPENCYFAQRSVSGIEHSGLLSGQALFTFDFARIK